MNSESILIEMGARIHSKRKQLGITQEQLAEKMEVSIQMISNLELGKKAIRPENLLKLCDTLNVSADYILRGKRSDSEGNEFLNKYMALSIEKQHVLDMLIESWLDE